MGKNDIARLNQSNRGPLVGRDRRDFRNRVKGIDGATRRLISKQHEEVEQVDELQMPAKDSEGRVKSRKIRATLRKGGQRARDAADKHYDAAANTHPDDHKGFVSSTQKAVDKDKVAKRRERAAEEVSVDEAMGGNLKD